MIKGNHTIPGSKQCHGISVIKCRFFTLLITWYDMCQIAIFAMLNFPLFRTLKEPSKNSSTVTGLKSNRAGESFGVERSRCLWRRSAHRASEAAARKAQSTWGILGKSASHSDTQPENNHRKTWGKQTTEMQVGFSGIARRDESYPLS